MIFVRWLIPHASAERTPRRARRTMMTTPVLRRQVIQLYKNMYYLGADYPKGADWFRTRLKTAFMKNKDESDPEKVKMLIARGEFVCKEVEALYMLKKYRAMKQRYYEDDDDVAIKELMDNINRAKEET